MIKYKNYLFEDEESGEEFVVEIRCTEEMTESHCSALALQRANEYFNNPTCLGKINGYEAEMLGLDTY